jgi:hypothetical protein
MGLIPWKRPQEIVRRPGPGAPGVRTRSLGPCYFCLVGFPAREGQMSILLARREFIAVAPGEVQERGMQM